MKDNVKSWVIPLWIISTGVIIVFLIVAKRLLIPLVIAIAIWYLIESLSRALQRIRFRKNNHFSLPRWLTLIISSFSIIGALVLVIKILLENFKTMAQSIPKYEDKLDQVVEYITQFFEFEEATGLMDLIQQVDIASAVGPVFDTVTNLLASLILIIIYVIFLILERNVLKVKIRKLMRTEGSYKNFLQVLGQINESIRTYISVKIFTSFLTGFLSYIVMELFGLDFAILWAFIIFALNFIPSIGSITATSLPLLFSLVQFGSFGTFFLLMISIVGIQILVGNYIDPRMMGSRLNISPLVILVSLVAWGSIWGFAGMIFSVPIMAVLIIIFAQFRSTKFIAILLSADGSLDVKNLGEKKEEVT